MFYKILKNDKVVDVLDRLFFVKYQPKHKIMVACAQSEAQAVISSDGERFWHIKGLYHLPIDGYDAVELEEIDEDEYRTLKIFNGKSPEQIIDEFVLFMLEEGIL